VRSSSHHPLGAYILPWVNLDLGIAGGGLDLKREDRGKMKQSLEREGLI
jgi:hypothetical protein